MKNKSSNAFIDAFCDYWRLVKFGGGREWETDREFVLRQARDYQAVSRDWVKDIEASDFFKWLQIEYGEFLDFQAFRTACRQWAAERARRDGAVEQRNDYSEEFQDTLKSVALRADDLYHETGDGRFVIVRAYAWNVWGLWEHKREYIGLVSDRERTVRFYDEVKSRLYSENLFQQLLKALQDHEDLVKQMAGLGLREKFAMVRKSLSAIGRPIPEMTTRKVGTKDEMYKCKLYS